jgi:hypothetical protein
VLAKAVRKKVISLKEINSQKVVSQEKTNSGDPREALPVKTRVIPIIDLVRDGEYNRPMSTLALEIDQTLRQLDRARATMLESMVRDVMERVKAGTAMPRQDERRQEWFARLDSLRSSVGTGKAGTSTEAIIDDIRSDRD